MCISRRWIPAATIIPEMSAARRRVQGPATANPCRNSFCNSVDHERTAECTGLSSAKDAVSLSRFEGVRAMDRRHLLKNSLAGLVGLGAANRTVLAQTVPLMDRPPALVPIRAHPDRIYDIKCCLRPFRTKGPNLSVEHIGD